MFFANIRYKLTELIEFNINHDILFLVNKWQKRKVFRVFQTMSAENTGNYTTYPY